MSRSSTTSPAAPPMAKPAQPQGATQQTTPHTGIPREKVAARAYQKWMQKGCKHGNDTQDWLEAEAELRAEMARAKK